MSDKMKATADWINSRCRFIQSDYPHRQCIAQKDHAGPHRDMAGPISKDKK
jgi:hypothetical protein